MARNLFGLTKRWKIKPSVTATRSAHHIKIQVTANGVTQHREHRYQVGAYSQHMLPTHFGLGQTDIAETVRVIWANGSETVLRNQPVDQYIKITQNANCRGVFAPTEATLFFCANQSIDLAIMPDNSAPVRWQILNGPSRNMGQFGDSNAAVTTFTPDTQGIYQLGITFDGCPDSQVVFNLVDSDYDASGTYNVGDVMVLLEAWNSQKDIEINDRNRHGEFNITDMLSFCYFNQPVGKRLALRHQ